MNLSEQDNSDQIVTELLFQILEHAYAMPTCNSLSKFNDWDSQLGEIVAYAKSCLTAKEGVELSAIYSKRDNWVRSEDCIEADSKQLSFKF